MSDGGWYGYPPQEPDPYAQPQDERNRSPLDHGNAAQAPGYDRYGRPVAPASPQQQPQQPQQHQQPSSHQQQYYPQQPQAPQQPQQPRPRPQQGPGGPQGGQGARRQPYPGAPRPQQRPQAPQSQNPYVQQQQQQGHGYDTGSYPAAQQYPTGQQPTVGYEGYPQQPGYDTGTHRQQPPQQQQPQQPPQQRSGSYDTAARTAGQGGRRGRPAPAPGEVRDPYADLAELAEPESDDEYAYPSRGGRRGRESTGGLPRVTEEGRLGLLGRDEDGKGPSAADDDDEDEGGRKGGKEKKGRRSCLVIFLFFAILAGAIGYGGFQGYKYYQSHYGPPADYSSATGDADTAIVQIPSNATGTQIGAILFTAGVIKSERAFTQACDANPQCGTIQAATYQLHQQMSAAGAVTALLNTANVYNKSQLLVRPGERASDVFADLEQKTGWTQAQVTAAVNSGQIDLPSYATAKPGSKYPYAKVEGMLFTGTYDLTSYKNPTALIKAMVDQQVKMFTAIGLTQKASAVHMTPYQVVIVASMARAEAGADKADLAKISGVIYTRLKDPSFSKLGFDTSTLYGLGRTTPQPTSAELADRGNPYNLRVINGLPPGPIDSVDQDALSAALNPTDSSDVFFCAVNGTVHYAANDTAWAALGRQFPGDCG